jgi:hypothetical protein
VFYRPSRESNAVFSTVYCENHTKPHYIVYDCEKKTTAPATNEQIAKLEAEKLDPKGEPTSADTCFQKFMCVACKSFFQLTGSAGSGLLQSHHLSLRR